MLFAVLVFVWFIVYPMLPVFMDFLNQGQGQVQLFVGGLMLPVFVDCPFLIVPSIFSNVYFLLFDMVDVTW